MNRREVLVSTLAVGALAGCLDNGFRSREVQFQTVEQTPPDITAEYTAIYPFDGDVPSAAADGQMLFTEAETAKSELEAYDEILNPVEAIDFDESDVVISANQTEGEIEKLTVDEIKKMPEGLQYEVQFEKDHMPGDDQSTQVVIISVTSEESHAESATVEWFEPVSCGAEYVPYHRLPDPVKREVDIALSEGTYETGATLLYPLAASESATLWNDTDYYDPIVTDDGETASLQFEPVNGAAGRPAVLYLANGRDDVVELTVTVSDTDETLVSEDVTINPLEHLELTANRFTNGAFSNVELTDAYGQYELTAETSDGQMVRELFTIDPEHHDRVLALFEDHDRYDAVEFYSVFELEDMNISKPKGTCINAGGWWGYPGE